MKTGLRALIATVVLVLLTGVVYPAVMTAFAQVALKGDADGSLVQRDGTDVGSSRIGQAWSGPRWFYGRPSAVAYDASTSSGSNLGPTSKPLSDDIASRIQQILKLEGPYTSGPRRPRSPSTSSPPRPAASTPTSRWPAGVPGASHRGHPPCRSSRCGS
jgi:K+-transporting ATPase KdpC subunit